MFKCPYCQYKTITFSKKVCGDSRFSTRVTCPHCFNKSKQPWWSIPLQMVICIISICIVKHNNFLSIDGFEIVSYVIIIYTILPALIPLKKIRSI